ncbi:MAG: 7-cyano-7-deazaguanine synthase QueC [Nitrospirota bacterium]|nr:7-cyano-7-deazaguanine synthase QueC [Nitrospirota bacterium]
MRQENNKKAVVLLSGGIDSSTALAVAKSEGYELYALTFDYNQRHKRELESAGLVASTLGAQKHLIIRFDLREIGGSALTSEIEVPKVRIQDTVPPPHPSPSRGEGKGGGESLGSVIPVTYVPARNTIFLSFAIAWAEVLGAENIFIGANAIDYSGYPDCRPEYLRAFEAMANLATKASVEDGLRFMIRAPLILMKKSEIIRKGVELGLDYSLTWSCYDPQPATAEVQSSKLKVKSFKGKKSPLQTQANELIPCGLCDSCIFRAKGFKEAGIKDPLIK